MCVFVIVLVLVLVLVFVFVYVCVCVCFCISVFLCSENRMYPYPAPGPFLLERTLFPAWLPRSHGIAVCASAIYAVVEDPSKRSTQRYCTVSVGCCELEHVFDCQPVVPAVAAGVTCTLGVFSGRLACSLAFGPFLFAVVIVSTTLGCEAFVLAQCIRRSSDKTDWGAPFLASLS